MSFDGGGTFGALSLQLINRLAQQDPKLIRRTNVFAGNSIGSFIALALASGRSPRETLQFFKDRILPAYSVSRPQIAVLSIGTGDLPLQLRRDTKGWGMVSSNNIRSENLNNLPPSWGVLF